MHATILVAAWGEGLFVVRGEGWAQEIAHESVRGLAADGRGGALALVGGHSLRRRGPGGEWTIVAESELELSCCMVVGDAIYVGTDDARMLRLREGGGTLEVMDGFDRVVGRESWFAGSAMVNGQRMGPPLGIRSVAANADGSVLFANVHVGGIPRSVDGGRTWEPTIAVLSDVHEVRGHPEDPEMVVAAAAVGLCISRDRGRTWSVESEGLHAAHCSAVGFGGGEILVSASVDPFVMEGRVYRRAVGLEGRLVAVEGGMPEWTEGKVDTGCIATMGSLVAMADCGGNLYCSEDGGRTWKRRVSGLPAAGGVLIC